VDVALADRRQRRRGLDGERLLIRRGRKGEIARDDRSAQRLVVDLIDGAMPSKTIVSGVGASRVVSVTVAERWPPTRSVTRGSK
jgi:hypothetical protein